MKDFRKFFDSSTFELYAPGAGNHDYYIMSTPSNKPCAVALAKPESGCADCFFGSIDYLKKHVETAYYHEARQEPQEPASAAQFVETLQYTEAAQRELERNYAILERSAI